MTLENPGSSILCKYQSSLERNFLQSYNFLLSTFGRDTLTSKALCIVHLISKVTELINQLNIFVIVILIIISKFVKRHWKANSRASAYTNPAKNHSDCPKVCTYYVKVKIYDGMPERG